MALMPTGTIERHDNALARIARGRFELAAIDRDNGLGEQIQLAAR